VAILAISGHNVDPLPSKKLRAFALAQVRPPDGPGAGDWLQQSGETSVAALMTAFKLWVSSRVAWCDSICSCIHSCITSKDSALPTIVTECPHISGCAVYTSDEECSILEREIGITCFGADKLTYVRPNQCSPNDLPSASSALNRVLLTTC
jgi:hypothetical protein